ncbi:MAG: hypothetical protein PUD07_05785 [bacterium]|nr:hypothetical protein [bacterium]
MESLTLNVRVDATDAINMFIKAVIREQKLPFEIKSNIFDEIIYEKLKEAELEMDNTTKRYTINDIERSMNSIINKK